MFFKNVRSFISRIKPKEIIAAVPPELKADFDQIQLKNSVYRLKLLGVITIIFNVLNWPIYIYSRHEMSLTILKKLFISDLSQLIITVLFFILTGYFIRKNKHFSCWFMCYLLIAMYFLFSLYTILFTEIFLVLQLYFSAAFLYIFIPDFKPKIFISFLTLWYLIVAGFLTYNNYKFIIAGPQVFVLNIFLIALVIRVIQYNGKVKTFINTFRINALNEKLEALSTTDELTKLDNRRSFLEYMNTAWVLSRRLQTPINILMIDVDYFKKYNDSLGHLEGDKALIAIAQCMKNNIKRETDLIARFGGEEFVCLLPFLEKDDALYFAKKLVQKIEDMKIPHPANENSKYVTVSIGLANTIPDDHNSYTQLLDEADKALYLAKKSGRNRVCF